MRRLLAVVALAAACGKSKTECRVDAADLMEFLHSFDHSGSLFQVDDAMHLVTRTDLPTPKEEAPVVVVDAKVTRFQGQLVDQPALASELGAVHARILDQIERRMVPRNNPRDPRLVYFQISGDAAWARVVAAVRAGSDAGFTRASFVFAMPSTQKPPPRTWVDDKFEATRAANHDGGNLATVLAELASTVVKSCPALTKAFGSVGSEEGGDKAAALIEATGPALIECNCVIDLPALRSIWWLVLSNPHPTSVLEVELDKDAKAVALPAETPWREASKKLGAGSKMWPVARAE